MAPSDPNKVGRVTHTNKLGLGREDLGLNNSTVPPVVQPPRIKIKIPPNMKSECLKAGFVNARSAIKHTTELYDLLTDTKIHFLGISETWFIAGYKTILDELLPQNYKIITKNRENRRGARGVSFMTKDFPAWKLACLQLSHLNALSPDVESMQASRV